ncbi:g10607 [Coccomyxa elongata]
MPGATWGAQAPPAPAPAPASGPPPSAPQNWGNNPFAAPGPGNAPFNPTPMFNTILITGVGIAAVLVCVIGCMVSMRFVRFGQLPSPAPASRRQRQDEADGTGGAKMEPSNVPMRRAVLVHNPDNDICCGVELTPSAGQPVDVPTPQEDAKASSSSADEFGDRGRRFHGDSLSEIELR